MAQIDRINGLVGDIAIKAPCRVATTGNITLSGFQTIDGVTLATGDSNLRVLVWQQTNAVDNGIWVASSGAWTRSADFDGDRDVTTGTLCKIISGTTYTRQIAELTTTGAITIGTTSLTFVMLTGTLSGTISAFAQTLLDDTSALVFRTTLNLGSAIVYPEDYGAVGDGTTNDATALNAAITALAAAGGGTLVLTKQYATSSAISITSSNIHVVGIGKKAGLKALGSSNYTVLNVTGSLGSALGTVTANIAAFATSFTATTPGNFANGDLLLFDWTITSPATYRHTFISEVISVVGSTVTIADAFPAGILTTDTYSIKKVTALSNISLRNLYLDFGSATGTTVYGFRFSHVKNSEVVGLFATGFPSPGIQADTGYCCTLDNINVSNCGGTDAGFASYHLNRCVVDGVISTRSGGFGILFEWANYCNIMNLSQSYADGRGIEFFGCQMNNISNLASNFPLYTGVTLQNRCMRNTITNIQAHGSKSGTAGDSIGFKTNGEHNINNIISNVAAYGNVDYDIRIYSADTGNVISGVSAGSTLNESTSVMAGFMGNADYDILAPVAPASYTVAGLPAASSVSSGAVVYVSNEVGGAVLAFTDGTNWRRVTDRAVVS